MKTRDRWLIGVAAPAAMATGMFVGAQMYESTPDNWPAFVMEREDQEPFVVDGNLVMFNILGMLSLSQVINHSSMIIWPPKKRKEPDTNEDPLAAGLDPEPLDN